MNYRLTRDLDGLVPGVLAGPVGYGQGGYGVLNGTAVMKLPAGTLVAGPWLRRVVGPAKFEEYVREGVLVPEAHA